MKLLRSILLTALCLLVFVNPIGANTDNPDVDILVLPNHVEKDMEIESDATVLMDIKNGDILFSKDPHKRLYPASTTKVLTGLLALEYGDMGEIVTIGNEANLCTSDGSRAGLDIGEEISLRHLIFGLMLPSGNDAAYSIAVHIGRKVTGNSDLSIEESVKTFVELMNTKAREIGAKDSHFANPDGYHHDSHYTTAYDMALIAQSAMANPTFREIVGTELFTIDDWASLHDPEAEEKEIRYWWNSNSLIQPNSKYHYPHATGIKTGYTSNAKHCLVSSASQGDVELIVVVLGATKPGKWTTTTMLFDYGFANFETYKPFRQNQQIDVLAVDGETDGYDQVEILVHEPVDMLIPKGRASNIEKEIIWGPEVSVKLEDDGELVSIKPPILKSQKVGTIAVKLEDKILASFDLITSKGVQIKDPEPIGNPTKLLEGVNNSGINAWIALSLWKKAALCIVITAMFLGIMVRVSINRRRKRSYTYRRRY